MADLTFVHIAQPRVPPFAAFDPLWVAEAALLREVNALAPAFVVATGELTAHGADDERDDFRRRFSGPLTAPLYALPGSADVRGALAGKAAFDTGQPLWRSLDRGGVHTLLLDTARPLGDGGHVGGAQLAWLKDDLRRVGGERPIVVVSAHTIAELDSDRALLDLLLPYNVRVWLSGSGESAVGDTDGIVTVTGRSLTVGEYVRVRVHGAGIDLFRRSESRPDGVRIARASLTRPTRPRWKVAVRASSGVARVRVERGNLSSETRLRATAGAASTELRPDDGGWSGALPAPEFPGSAAVRVVAQLPDGRSYVQSLSVPLAGPGALAPAWSVDLGDGVVGPILAGDALVLAVTESGALVAVERRTGARRWSFRRDGALLGAATLGDGAVFVGASDHTVHALDLHDGRPLWKKTVGASPIAGLAVCGETLGVVSGDGALFGLSVERGAPQWKTPLPGAARSRPSADRARFFVGARDGVLTAIDGRTGRIVWQRALGNDPDGERETPTLAAPAVDGALALAASATGIVRAVRADSGAVLWSAPPGTPPVASLWASDGAIVGCARDGASLVAFARKDGARLWRAPVESSVALSGGAFTDGVVVVGGEDGTLFALQTDAGERHAPGTLLWRYRLGGGALVCPPSARDGMVYAGSLGGTLVALPILPPSLRA